MRGLASFVMKGLSSAVMVAAPLAILSLLFPPVGILSAAVIGLVTLRKGVAAGLTVIGVAAFVCGVLGYLLLGSPIPVIGFCLVAWLPVWGVSILLRSTRSIGMAIQVTLGFGALVVAAYYFQNADPVSLWKEMLQPLGKSLVEAEVLTDQEGQLFITQMAGWMTGVLAAGFYLQSVGAVLLARWWQANLYNPGGFREEFHNLRLHRGLVIAASIVVVWLLFQGASAPAFIRDIGLLLMAMFLIQGLAVAHSLVAQFGARRIWLIMLYVLLIFIMPHAAMIVAIVGMFDPWMDVRARVKSRQKAE